MQALQHQEEAQSNQISELENQIKQSTEKLTALKESNNKFGDKLKDIKNTCLAKLEAVRVSCAEGENKFIEQLDVTRHENQLKIKTIQDQNVKMNQDIEQAKQDIAHDTQQ